MEDLKEIKAFFKKNIGVFNELMDYLQKGLEQKFIPAPSPDILSEAYKGGILEKSGNQFKLKFEYINYVFFVLFKEKFNIAEISSIEEYADFTNQVENILSSIKGGSLLWCDFDAFLLIYFNRERCWDYRDYVISIDPRNRRRDFFEFYHNFTKALPFLRISKENLSHVAEHLYEGSKGDFFNYEVFEGIRGYCKQNHERGWEFVEYIVKAKKHEIFLASALSALSELDFERTFAFTREIFNKKRLRKEAILAFGNLKYPGFKYIAEVLNLFDKIKTDDENILAFLAKTYGLLASNPLIVEKGKVDYCLEKLEDLAKMKNPVIQYEIAIALHRLSPKEDLKGQIYNILMYFYDIDLEHKGIIERIIPALASLKEPAMILDFIKKWILNHPSEDDPVLFRNPLGESIKTNPSDFIYHFIRLLIDSKGIVRCSANKYLLWLYQSYQNTEIWKKHILDLQFMEQLKFMDSVLLQISEPVKRLKLVLVLKNSQNKEIHDALLKHLIWMNRDFGKAIEDEVELNLDRKIERERRLLDAFMKYRDRYVEIFNNKIKIKEFDPRLNQARWIAKYSKSYARSHSELAREEMNKRSNFYGMARKVSIGRGSKYKLEGQTTFSGFHHFKQGILLPRTYFIFPELFEYVKQNTLMRDWSDSND